MATQPAAKQDYDEADQQVPQASGSSTQQSCKKPKFNRTVEDSSLINGAVSSPDAPVNGLGHGSDTEVSPESEACSGHNGTSSGFPYLNGFVTPHGRTSAILSLQPNCPARSEIHSENGIHRSNGNINVTYSCEEANGGSVDQRVPDLETASSAQDSPKGGSRPKKLKKRHHGEQRHGRNCANGVSQGDEKDNVESSSRENVLTCTGFFSYAHAGVMCNGTGSVVQASQSNDFHQRHNNNYSHGHGQNNLPHQGFPGQRGEEDADVLDMVDEGAVCDFDRNVFVDENSFCDPEDASVPMCSASNSNISGDYQNGHVSRDSDEESGMRHHRRQVRQYYSPHFQNYTSDSDEDYGDRRVPNVPGGARGPEPNRDRQDQGEDNGDFIDADLPSVPGQLLSSSDSASLSSSNGDLAEPAPLCFPADHASSRQENNLSGGSDKELNHRPESPEPQIVPDNAVYRTSYSSQSHDGGFDNFLAPHELSSSDGVFGNSSESENEEELSETLPLDGQDGVVPVLEGAGVAEAMASPPVSEQAVDGHQFAAVGDLCFHFDSACSLRENEWQTEHTASSMPLSYLAGQSASRHDPCPHLPLSPPEEEGEAGGACAPPPPLVNNLSRLHPVTPGSRAVESMANGLDDVAPSNFINDESNRQLKVFVKFPMMREGRDGACGSGAGQGKCEGDNVRCPCPCPGPQVSAYNSSADMGMEADQANLTGSLGPNVESFGGVMADFKHSPRDMQWFANSESGVSEPIYEEISDYQMCPDSECSISHNALHPANIKKGGKEGKKKRIVCRPIENGVDGGSSVDRVMIWNEYEAYLLQVKQIGMSACGQTAVLNLLKAFELPAEKKVVCCKIHVNLRKEKASIAEYLASRAVAGTTAEELLQGVERLTKGEIRGRFFPFWPPRDVQLLSWISQWMKRGAVPIATLNLQLGVKQQQVPDAWHHQMVYGVGPRGVYLTNPLEIVPEETMMEQLTSDSVLLVRRQDVVSRFQPTASLAPLMHHQDPRWCTMNVLGQVVNVLREHNMPSVPGYRAQVTSHIRIPAVYRAGITLYVRHNTDEWKALRDAPDLPRKMDRQDSAD